MLPRPLNMRALLLKAVLVVAMAIGLTPVLATPAMACICVPRSDVEKAEHADVVFSGTVSSREAPPEPGDGPTFTFVVTRVYKGEADERQRVVSSPSGCALEISGSGPFLVFANRRDDLLTGEVCGGTRRLDPGPQAALGPGHNPVQVASQVNASLPEGDVDPDGYLGDDDAHPVVQVLLGAAVIGVGVFALWCLAAIFLPAWRRRS